jgi:hypothetical protein
MDRTRAVSIQSFLDSAARFSSFTAVLAAAAALAGCQPSGAAEYPESPFLPAISAPFKLPEIQPLSFAPAPEPEPVPAPVAEAPKVRMWTDWSADRALPGILRSRRAQESRLPVVKELFARAGVAFPPAQLAFVAYKDEKELEVWASSEEGGRAERIATYGICAASGLLGPKRFEGDRQVPEGHYVLQYGWAESNYHLEMKVSYPNMVDKVLGPKDRPLGGEIMIHGDCASIGCLAMGDERVEELWVMMKAKGDARVKVQIYPSRDMDALLGDRKYAPYHAFWRNLKEGRDLFENERRFISVKADWHGVYMYE